MNNTTKYESYAKNQVAYILELHHIQKERFDKTLVNKVEDFCNGDLFDYGEMIMRTYEKLWKEFLNSHNGYFTELCEDNDLVEEKLNEVIKEMQETNWDLTN